MVDEAMEIIEEKGPSRTDRARTALITRLHNKLSRIKKAQRKGAKARKGAKTRNRRRRS